MYKKQKKDKKRKTAKTRGGFKKITKEIGSEIGKVLNKIDTKKTKKLTESILHTKSIFVTGQGRSGLIGKAFVMRLMQLGLKGYAVGEVVTPAIKHDDLLVVISGSGETPITLEIVKGAKKQKSKICVITANKKSRIAKESSLVIEIPCKIDHKIEPLGSLFEQAALLYLDSVVIGLMKKLRKRSADLRKKHANL